MMEQADTWENGAEAEEGDCAGARHESGNSEDVDPVARFVEFREARPGEPSDGALSLDQLRDVPITMRVEVGRTNVSADETLKLKEGSVIRLEKLAGEPLDLFLRDTQFARGEVAVVDGSFRLRITDIITDDAEPD
jgi:flagellar motor switch protein FliN/FliY